MSRESKRKLIGEVAAEVRASQAATDRFDALAAATLGINRTDARCLDLLGQDGGAATAGRLALLSGLTTAAVTGVIDRLERKGYAERVADPADRRRVLVRTTDLLQERAGAIWAPMGEEAAQALGRYGADELRTVLRFLRESRELHERHATRVAELRFE